MLTVKPVKGIDIQLHHSSQWQKLYTCPRIRIKKSCESNYVIKSCEGRKEIVSSAVDEPNPVVESDVTETNQTRYRGTPEDVQVEGQVPEMDAGQTEEPGSTEESEFLQDGGERNKRPQCRIQEHGKYKDFVCRIETNVEAGVREEEKVVKPAPRKLTPRKCKFCDLQLEGRQDQRRHIQDVHKDILARNREQARTKRQLTEQDDPDASWIDRHTKGEDGKSDRPGDESDQDGRGNKRERRENRFGKDHP